jgi:diguanylate cyclase (GGDEF)-like protein/PAS domain S-box-containing protein
MLDGYYRSTHAGKFVDVNPAMVKMFGYSSKKEMLEVDIKKELYFSPEERGSHILDSGQGETDIFRMRRKDGTEIWVEDRGFYIYDEQGMPIFHEGSLREITQRKQAEDELRRAKESLEVMNMELRFAFENEQNMARTDVLTGINNRRNLFDLAEHEFEVAKRYRQPLSIIMFDIDYFKQINDSFGHALGDKMLQRVAQAAHAQLRDVDMIGRYGGEEFVIVLPVTSANKAYLVAQRILESVAAIRLNTDQGSAAVTLSIGIAEILHTPPDGSVDNLIHRADEALLLAKQAGRNRAMLFGPDQMREI